MLDHLDVIRMVLAQHVQATGFETTTMIADPQIRIVLRAGDREAERAILVEEEDEILRLVSAVARVTPAPDVARRLLAPRRLPPPFRFCLVDNWYAIRAEAWPPRHAPYHFSMILERMLALVLSDVARLVAPPPPSTP